MSSVCRGCACQGRCAKILFPDPYARTARLSVGGCQFGVLSTLPTQPSASPDELGAGEQPAVDNWRAPAVELKVELEPRNPAVGHLQAA